VEEDKDDNKQMCKYIVWQKIPSLKSIIHHFLVVMSVGIGGQGEGDGNGANVGGQDSSTLLSSSHPLPLGSVNFWDSIVVSIISIAASIAAYFIIKYLLKRTADSLNLDKRELKGINSIAKMVLIVISIIIIIFQFSSVSGVAAGAISVAAGTIIGFSSRNTISNAIAGILLLSSRPFKIGDRIRTTEDDSLEM
jgi:small-conductance mechanosensitive channel